MRTTGQSNPNSGNASNATPDLVSVLALFLQLQPNDVARILELLKDVDVTIVHKAKNNADDKNVTHAQLDKALPGVEAVASQHTTLSERHLSLLLMLYRGLTNKEIATILGVAPRTVKGYLSTLFAHFDVSNRMELVSVAIDSGILSTDLRAAS